jgi:small subunit ribosomal protein S6
VSALFCELGEGSIHGKEHISVTRLYELTFIVKPDLDATNLASVLEKVKDYISAESGSIIKLDQWGMRRLMYPIRKFREGQYVFALLQLEAASIIRIESRLKLNEDIIRYLLIRADDEVVVAAPADGQAASAETAPVAEATAAPEATAVATMPAASEATPSAGTNAETPTTTP